MRMSPNFEALLIGLMPSFLGGISTTTPSKGARRCPSEGRLE